jgi:hypothetical protein
MHGKYCWSGMIVRTDSPDYGVEVARFESCGA